MLVRGIESARTKGDKDPHLEMILAVAREDEEGPRDVADVETAFREAFFAPCECFLVQQEMAVRQKGRIQAASVDPIWIWFKRDVARDLIETTLSGLEKSAGALEEDAAKAADEVRQQAVPLARKYIEALSADEDGLQKLAGQLGTRKILDDARDVLDIFQNKDALDTVLWNASESLEDDQDAPLLQQLPTIKAFADKYPQFLHLLAIRYLTRVKTPSVLVRLAILIAKTDVAPAIERSIYAPFIDVAFSEIERCVEVVRARKALLDRDGTLAEAVLDLHRVVRRIQIAIDVEGMTSWGRRLSRCRSETSEILRETIEGTPGLVKRALRPRTVGDKVAAPPDDLVREARDALEVLGAARRAIDSLALNQNVKNARALVEQVIEKSSRTLIDRLRDAPSEERAALTEIVEAAIDYANIVFGEEYSALLRRSLHVATTKPTLKTAG